MKIRAVREKRGVRRVLLGEADQLPVFPIDCRQMTGHFSQTDYAQLREIYYGGDACRFKLRSRRSIKFG